MLYLGHTLKIAATDLVNGIMIDSNGSLTRVAEQSYCEARQRVRLR
jgi:hypothetical protein